MAELYAYLWHISGKNMGISEGAAGSWCESAETNKSTKKKAKNVLKTWLDKRQKACQDPDCEHTPIITDEFDKMFLAGMTENMVKIR